MKLREILCLVILSILLTACQQGDDRSEVIRDPEAPLGPDEFETTDEGFTQINQPGPRTFDQTGESVDVIRDKKTIKQAAERMPDVKVQSVSINQSDAYVRVKINAPMNEFEKKDWSSNIKSAIEGVTQRYDVHVSVE
ncbi:hypothetical protein [Aquibacillus saliphilus]|uniref:hypothetical protein n=1 Tax=Aquibacillus saliphilus TaxID=1909422 RepID=UPI001CF0A912|nr:hypothetical protein [Aquibacillus saliphilus]